MEFTISNRMKDMKGSAIREIFKVAADPTYISLAGGNPAPELFPAHELAEIAAELLEKQPVRALQYGVTEGDPELRTQVKERLARVEKIGTNEDEVLIVSGGQQAIDLTTKNLINEGDTVIVEEPSFIGALNAFRSFGAKLAGVPMDHEGMQPDALERVIAEHPGAKMIYTIPTFQNPMGVTMPLERRRAVYEIAKKHGLVIIEDNPYGELAFDGVKVPTIKSMDTDGIVVYCGSFSKVLAPGLRIGFVYANRALIQKLVVAKQVEDVHTPMLTQLLASEYLKRYNLDDVIVKMRALYRRKCAGMLAAIERYFPEGVTHTTPKGGLFVWCDLGHGLDTQKLTVQAMARKVVYVPGATFMTDMNRPCSGLRLNYSTMTDDRIEEGIRLLGEVFTEALDKLEESDE